MTQYSLMTKKYDDIHILQSKESGKGSETLCGKPFLGNDYMRSNEYQYWDELAKSGPRKACVECLRVATVKLNELQELARKAPLLGSRDDEEDFS